MEKTYSYMERYDTLFGCGMSHEDAIWRIADERNEPEPRIRNMIDNYLAGMFWFLQLDRQQRSGEACGI